MLAGVAAVLAAAATAGCGGGEEPAVRAGGEPGPVHVHGLGVNPRDGALFLATHTGIWRSAAGSRTAERVGDSHQDTMGFTVVGADHFLGSGHPDLRQARDDGLPPHLGLIESRDAARSWTPRSLLGEADFHLLEAAGPRIYGYDATTGRLLASTDGGGTWDERAAPRELIDLALDPRHPGRLMAATESGLAVSVDAARSWEESAAGVVGLLAWSRDGRLYLVDRAGLVSVSTDDEGRSWQSVGELPGEPAAFAASDSDLYAALHEGGVVASRDGGTTWITRVDG